ncbi:MAG: hypothetical protein KDH15_10040 [Rhodocyclaceae bacterium]|nr:hypothetical protein [Rhodocyclaceae bacterium]
MKLSLDRSTLFVLAAFVLIAAVYSIFAGNPLVFDDRRLADGTVFGAFGGFEVLRPRLLSYGSFVWIERLFGDGWVVQRLVNLALHGLTGAGAWFLVRGLMAATDWRQLDGEPPAADSLRAAAAAGVALFLVNPVAFYAVGYLVQRSIVMAALFSVWALVAVLAAARSRRPAWLLVALLLYLLALLSKEHAVMLPLPAIALYAIVRRPPAKVVAAVSAVGLCVLAGLGALLSSHYSGVVGQAFDERSIRFLGQLEALRPGVESQALGLSIVNQAWLFFRYGLLWLVPNVLWMSVDLRPPFPLSIGSFPQVIGAPLYLALVVVSVWMMVRCRDWRQYLGFALFLPASLFATEFATVWVQDPFVLYRSYLWALAMPLAFAFPFIGARPATIFAIAGVLVVAFSALSFERARTFRSDASLWADAAAKHDADAAAAAVGRGRAFMWRGNDLLARGMAATALQDYDRALAAGEPAGQVHYHRAAALKLAGQDEAALRALDAAEAAGGDPVTPAAVDFLRAQIFADLGRHGDALGAAQAALAIGLDAEDSVRAYRIVAEGHARARRHAEAAAAFAELLAIAPDNRSARVGHALSLNALGRRREAAAELDTVLEAGDGADVRFGRALVLLAAGQRAAALAEARRALAHKPGDPAITALVGKLSGS